MVACESGACEPEFASLSSLLTTAVWRRSFGIATPRISMCGALRVRRRTRVVGAFPDAQPALNLAAARLRHIAGTAWSTKRYLNIELLKDQQMRGAIVAEKS